MRRIVALISLLGASVLVPAATGEAQVAPCALYTPVPPPAEGVAGLIFVAQIPGACRGEERQYRATIDWGDGTPPGVDLPLDANGAVGGRHVYRRAGQYAVSARVTDLRTGAQQVLRRSVPIRNQLLSRGPRLVVRGSLLRVARFRDGNPLAEPRDFKVRVRAGGRTHAARVVRDGTRGFAVILARRLPARVSRAAVRITDDREAKLSITSPVRVRRS